MKIIDEDEAKICIHNEKNKSCVEAIVQGFWFHWIKLLVKVIIVSFDIGKASTLVLDIGKVSNLDVFLLSSKKDSSSQSSI